MDAVASLARTRRARAVAPFVPGGSLMISRFALVLAALPGLGASSIAPGKRAELYRRMFLQVDLDRVARLERYVRL